MDITPSYCPIYYTETIGLMDDNDSNAITSNISAELSSVTYEFYWDENLYPVTPVAQTQVVTVTVWGTTKYPPATGSPSQVKAATSFILSFKNPCRDANRVTIIGPDSLP